ncbi:hypothetical protein N9E02_01500 [Ilumatobacteraceae bacterium]|nr:hypothetical protein [Ilumatobacteraceae bacterium]
MSSTRYEWPLDDDLADVLRDGSSAADRDRRLPPASVDALDAGGLLRLCLPREFGGPGITPMDVVAAISAVSRIDGAAGWCSMISSTTCALAGFLPDEVAMATFGSGRAFGGVFVPNGRFEAVGNETLLTGRWQWGSGLHHCDYIVAGAVGVEGERRTFVLPAGAVMIEDTWHTVGMRGSGSVDFAVNRLPVDIAHSVAQVRPEVVTTDPISRFPNFALLASSVAAVAAGIAEHAFDEVLALVGARAPQFSSKVLAEHTGVQASMSRRRVELDAASRFLEDLIAQMWELTLRGVRPGLSERVALRSGAAHLAAVSKNVVDALFSIAGGAAVYESSDLGRCLRDVHVVNQHIMVADRLHESLGRHLVGLPLDDGMI